MTILGLLANILLSPIAFIIFNLFYYIFIYPPLYILNSLWSIFVWFSGLSIGQLFFNNDSMAASGGINFTIDWNNEFVRVFVMFVIIGVIVFVITLIVTLLAHMFKNKISDMTLEHRTTPLRTLKWVVLFPVIIFIIPFGLILMSFFVTLLSQAISSGFSMIDPNLGIASLNYNLTNDNINYLSQLTGSLNLGVGDIDKNSAYYQIDGISGFINDFGNGKFKSFIDSVVNDLNGLDTSKFSDNDKGILNQLIAQLNSLENISETQNWSSLNSILNTINSISTIKNNDIANNLNNYLQTYVGSNGLIVNFENVNSLLQQLINSNLINITDSNNSNFSQNVADYYNLFGNNSNFISMFFTQQAINVFHNNNAIGLCDLPSYMYTTSTYTTTNFFGTLAIYQFATNDLNYGATNWWMILPLPFDLSSGVNLFGAFVAVILCLNLMILYILFLAKRLIELACYFVLSPIVAAMAVHDEGAKLTAWLKLVSAKMFSIIIMNITFEIFYIFYPMIKNLSDEQLSNWLTQSFMGFFTYSQLMDLLFLIGGMVAAYLATTKLSKFIGDDTSLAETFAEMAILRTATKQATGILKTGAKIGIAAASQGTSLAMEGGRVAKFGSKFFTSDGKIKRFGAHTDSAIAERKEMFKTMQKDGQITIAGETFHSENFNENSFINNSDVQAAQLNKWKKDNDIAGEGGKWSSKWDQFKRGEL